MLEPVAAVIYNTVLSGRPHLGHTGSLLSIAKVTIRSSRTSFTSNFFIPQPRREKGKEKATALGASTHEQCRTNFLSQCQDWCTTTHCIPCTRKNGVLVVEETVVGRDRSYASHSPHQRSSPSLHRRSLRSRIPMRTSHGLHARYASQMSEPPSPFDETDDVGPSEASRPNSSSDRPSYGDQTAPSFNRLEHLINAPAGVFNLDLAWDTYMSVSEDKEVLDELGVSQLLHFSDRVMSLVEKDYETSPDLETIHSWGRRIHDMVSKLTPKITPNSGFAVQQKCALARALALNGQIAEATSLVREARSIDIPQQQKGDCVVAYGRIIRTILRHFDAIHVLDYLVGEWPRIEPYLKLLGAHARHHPPRELLRGFQDTAFSIITQIKRPADVFAHTAEERNRKDQRVAGELLFLAFMRTESPFDALDVINAMKTRGLEIALGPQLELVRALTKESAFGPAKALFGTLEPNKIKRKVFFLKTALHLFAHTGDSTLAEHYFGLISEHRNPQPNEVALLMHSYATQGRAEHVVKLFNEFFPEGPSSKRENDPMLLHFSILIHAHAQKGDMHGLNFWLEQLSKHGFRPDIYIYTMILQGFSKRGDMDSIAVVLAQIKEDGLEANVVTYTTIITLLANRKDPVGAESIYKRAIQEGIQPTRRMITALMNAHVDAGSWRGVIRAYDYIRLHAKGRIRLTIEVYNTLLKAYVLIGAPFHMVSKLFSKLESAGVQADSHTFSLLIQSACDARRMDIASDIFHEMDKVAGDLKFDLSINTYVLTIIMAGYLRANDKIRAKAVYDDMLDRGIKPDAIAYQTIIRSYGNERTAESIQLAEEFIQSLVETPPAERHWDVPSQGRKNALDRIYGTLMKAHRQMTQPEDTERVFQEMLKQGGEPSLGSLTTLLDVYRRTFNIDAVLQLWPQIFQLALKYAKHRPLFGDDSEHSPPLFQNNVLCIPLSIYIDALSAAGQHLEIAAVWKNCQVNGFVFDPHNWNHLAVALVRAGEPERAFQTIEKVILPYQRQSLRLQNMRVDNPQSPLIFDDVASEEGEMEPASEPALHSTTRRDRKQQRFRREFRDLDIEDDEPDFALPLQTLHSFSPAWNMWRPHRNVLFVLYMAMRRLEAGAPVDPVKPDGGLTHSDNIPMEEQEERRALARDTLNRIYGTYPETVQLVKEYEAANYGRLRKLNEKYNNSGRW